MLLQANCSPVVLCCTTQRIVSSLGSAVHLPSGLYLLVRAIRPANVCQTIRHNGSVCCPAPPFQQRPSQRGPGHWSFRRLHPCTDWIAAPARLPAKAAQTAEVPVAMQGGATQTQCQLRKDTQQEMMPHSATLAGHSEKCGMRPMQSPWRA